MTDASIAADFHRMTGWLVHDYDVVDVVARVLESCTQALDAAAVGIVVLNAQRHPELLGSTSHESAQLELFEIQFNQGPCIEAIKTGRAIAPVAGEELGRRWPDVSLAMDALGFRAVCATPLLWHDEPFGALNLFFTEPPQVTEQEMAALQSYARITTLAIVHMGADGQRLLEQVQSALDSRYVIEIAKGVVMAQEGLSMANAYGRLLEVARSRHELLTIVARQAVQRAEHGQPWELSE